MRDLLNPEARDVGRPKKGDNVRITNNKASDTESYALRRLKRDRPEHTKAPPTIGRWGWGGVAGVDTRKIQTAQAAGLRPLAHEP